MISRENEIILSWWYFGNAITVAEGKNPLQWKANFTIFKDKQPKL